MRNILFTLLLYAVVSNAQNLTIKSVSLQPNDLTAVEKLCLDQNGDTCALLKIKTDNLEGVEFPEKNQYIKIDYIAGTYHVYVPTTIGRKITLHHKDYLPFQLDMAEYGYKKLRAGKTYLIVLDVSKKNELQSSVIMNVEPKQAQVIFDGQECESNPNGTYKLSVSTGNHSYVISAPNYHSQNGSVTIGKTETKPISVRLKPVTHQVLVKSNIKNARVFVDNIDYGRVGMLAIPQGVHTIRVQADGYVDDTKEAEINADLITLSFELKENKRITHIHATPVTIFSSSNRIYKNNKEIKDWENGAAVMFMPGKYMLSNDKGKKKIKITVKSKPLRVDLDNEKVTIYSEDLKVVKLDKDSTNNVQTENNTDFIPALRPIYGALNVAYKPIGATISIDSKIVGTTPIVLGEMLVGRHEVSISKNGYSPYKTSVEIVEGKTARLEGSLAEIQMTNIPSIVEEMGDGRIFDVPEESAEFPGDIYHWLDKNMKYPPRCQEEGIQGRVSVQFVINKDGSIVDAKVVRSPNDLLSAEALRLVKMMPKWKPARQGNNPVRMRYLLPITFRIKKQ